LPDKEDLDKKIEGIVLKDIRYAPEAYLFIMDALQITKHQLRREGHVSGQELSHGIKNFGLYLFGLLTKKVFANWGIYRTSDFGNIVYNLIEADVFGKSEEDNMGDFEDIFDFQDVLVDNYPFRFGD
jgi:uncharacterized repeat protein (TIGR04138 family)